MARSLVLSVRNAVTRRGADSPPVPFARASVTLPWTDRTDSVGQMRAYGGEPTLYACVSRLANATASAEWHLYRKSTTGRDEDRDEVLDHAALDIWNHPNNFYTRQLFVEAIEQHLDLTGDSYWVIGSVDPTSTRMPTSLWPVRPDRIEPVQSAREFIAGYIYTTPDGSRVPLDVDEVIHIMTPDPLDPFHGLGPVRSLLTDLDASRFASEWNRNFFLNSAQPGGVIEVGNNLTDTQFDELRARWAEQHRGVSAAHRVAILEAGMRWVERSYSRRDMEFTSLQKVSDERIMLAFGMSKVLLGQTESVNRATAEAAEYVFGRYQLVPRLNRIRDALNTMLLPRYQGGEQLEFDYESPVTGNAEVENQVRDSKVAAATALLAAGFTPESVLGHLDLQGLETMVDDDAISPMAMAELISNLAAGVGSVVTVPEARAVLALAGVPLQYGAGVAVPELETSEVEDPPGDEEPEDEPASGVGPEDEPDNGDQDEDGEGDEDAARVAAAVRRAVEAHHPHHRNSWGWSVRPRNAGDPPDLDPSDLPDISAMGEAHDEILNQLIEDWATMEDDQKAALVAQILAIAESGSIDDLADLDVDLDPAVALLVPAMIAMGDAAAESLVAEAAEQGVTIKPRDVDTDEVSKVALVVAGLVAGRLIGGARAAALRANGAKVSASQVAAQVTEHLAGLSVDTPRQQLGGALTGTANEARMATLRKAPEVAVYAHEVLDQNTCKLCREIDGKWLGNFPSDEAGIAELYPAGAYGGYTHCLGQERCRGTIAAVWRTRTTGG